MSFMLPENMTLESVMEIDEVLYEIALFERKRKHLEGLKRHRASILDEKIKRIATNVDDLRKVILNTMRKYAPDDKTLDFPSVGKATRKSPQKRWIVDDEKKLISFLEKSGIKDQIVSTVEKISKKDLNRELSALPDSKAVKGATLDPGEESISITFEKQFKPKESTQTQEYVKTNVDNFDIEEMEDVIA